MCQLSNPAIINLLSIPTKYNFPTTLEDGINFPKITQKKQAKSWNHHKSTIHQAHLPSGYLTEPWKITHIWRFLAGKIIYKWAIYTMAILNNQGVTPHVSGFPKRFQWHHWGSGLESNAFNRSMGLASTRRFLNTASRFFPLGSVVNVCFSG